MPYGIIKVDTITFTAGGVDTSVSISGLVQNPTFSGNITTTGTISGVTVIGSTTVSGATVTGTTASFTAITGGTAGFTTVTGTTVTGTTANFATLSGTTVTGNTVHATTITGISGVFTSQISGATVTGNAGSFTTVTGGVATITSGVFASGTAALPSISINSDPNTGVFSPGADQLAISTNSVERLKIGTSEVVFNDAGNDIDFRVEGDTNANLLFVDASADAVGIGTTSPSATLHVKGGNGNAIYTDNDGSQFSGLEIRNNGTDKAYVQYDNTNALYKVGSRVSAPIQFLVGDTERARIDTSGRLGIGTTSPSESLTVGSGNLQVTSGQLALGSLGTSGLQFINNGTIGTVDSQPLIFRIAATERCRVDTSGRLLVGTTSAGDTSTAIFQGNSFSSTGGAIVRAALGSASPGSTAVLGELAFSDNTHKTAATIKGLRDGGSWSSSSLPSALTFSTTKDGLSNPTERMIIKNNGNILIGTTTDLGALICCQSWGQGIKVGQIWNHTSSISSGSADVIAFQHQGATVGYISITNTSTAYNESSDHRLKENVAPLINGITRLQQLKPHRFNFIADPDKTVDGFIAHEVQDIVPEAIHGEKDAVDDEGNPIYQGIDKSKLVPLLTAALQEAVAKIETLEARLTAAGIE